MTTQQHKDLVERARKRLEDAALNYARMKSTGTYVENDTIRFACGSDVSSMTEMFLSNLQLAATRLLEILQAAPLPKRKP